MRINKFLAGAGVASRRKSESFVLEGKVKVNNKVVKDLSLSVGENDLVEVDGEIISAKKKDVYLMLHKPKGCVSTSSDEMGRKTIFDFVPEEYKSFRLFSIGRLDYNTEGLIILTTDGDLAQRLSHPKTEVEKIYVATVHGKLTNEEVRKLEEGVKLDDGYVTAPARVKLIGVFNEDSRVQITITEGKNRQVRRMFEAIGREIDFLVRKQVGSLKLGGLSRGRVRILDDKEINILKRV